MTRGCLHLGEVHRSGAALWGCVLHAPGSLSLHSRGAAHRALLVRGPAALGRRRGSQTASSLGKVGYRTSSGTDSPCGSGTDPLKRAGKGTGPRHPTVIWALGAGAGRYGEEARHKPALQLLRVLERKGMASFSSCCLSKLTGARKKSCGLRVEQPPLQT